MITISNPNVPGALVQGDRAHPVDLHDHIFGPIFVEVHWVSGGTAVLEMIDVPGTSFVDITLPSADMSFRYDAGAIVLPADIRDDYAIKTLVDHDEGPWRAENPIDELVVDGFFNGPTSDTAALDAARASGTAMFGYPPNLEVVDAFAVFRLDSVTEPDGSHISYYGHYTTEHNWYAITDGYGNPTIMPDPIIAYVGNTELVWYRHRIRPPVDYEKLRQSWIINFATGKTQTMQIASSLVICQYTLRTFKNAVKFVINSDATITVQNLNGTPAVPSFTGTGDQSNGPLRYFTSSGFI